MIEQCRGLDCSRLTLLRTIAQVLAKGHLDVDVWQEVFALLRRTMGLRRGLLMMATADGGELVVEAADDAAQQWVSQGAGFKVA